MRSLEAGSKELKKLRARVQRAFGMNRITMDTFTELTAQIDNLDEALDVAEQKENHAADQAND